MIFEKIYYGMIRIIGLLSFHILRPSLQYVQENSEGSMTGVEVGVQYGHNAKVILDMLSINKLYLVDPYSNYNSIDINRDDFDVVKKIAHKKLRRYKDRIVWLEDLSENCISKIPDMLDFVYIDGNHSYEFVKKDIGLFYPKLRIGGVLCGHDFDRKGVAKAVTEFFDISRIETRASPVDWWVVKDEE